jgi:ribosomal protein L35
MMRSLEYIIRWARGASGLSQVVTGVQPTVVPVLGGNNSLNRLISSCRDMRLALWGDYGSTRLFSSGTRAVEKSPQEAGGPPKPLSSFKRRFKVTGSGSIRCMSPGFVHKRFNKSKKRLNRLSKGILVPPSYEKVMLKLGFSSRRF